MRHLTALTLLTAGAFCLPATPASAHGADDVIRECTEAVEQAVERTRNAVASDVERCVRAIKKHKRNGDEAKARRVARKCIRRINNVVDAADEHIRGICARCVNALLDFGEVELAERFRNWCADQLEKVQAIGKRGRRAIREALNC